MMRTREVLLEKAKLRIDLLIALFVVTEYEENNE